MRPIRQGGVSVLCHRVVVVESVNDVLTHDMEVDDFAAYRERVDGTAISAGVVVSDTSDLQVPLVDVRVDDTEPRVVDDSSLVVC